MPINLHSGDDYDARESLPSLRQYLKSVGAGKLPPRFIVTTIWKPNQFPNWTFETEKFRVRIKSHTHLGKLLHSSFGEWEESEPVIAIKIVSKDEATFEIVDIPGERAKWSGLGETGWRITVLDKKK